MRYFGDTFMITPPISLSLIFPVVRIHAIDTARRLIQAIIAPGTDFSIKKNMLLFTYLLCLVLWGA